MALSSQAFGTWHLALAFFRYAFAVRPARIAGIVILAALVLYVVWVAALSEWMIAGIHFHWPWHE
jgi:hypothetical protein